MPLLPSFKKTSPRVLVGGWLAAIAVVAGVFPSAASAITPTIREFNAGITNGYLESIVRGPDGNMWFTERGSVNGAIGRINPVTHKIDEFRTGLDSKSDPTGITVGSDKNLWFTDRANPGHTGAIGRINPVTGEITEFSTGLSSQSDPMGIAPGPDGNVWFTDLHPPAIGRINPFTQKIDEFSAGLKPGGFPVIIARGPDRALWFTHKDTAIGRVSTSGAIQEFPVAAGGNPIGITAGPDGNVWFTDPSGLPSAIGRINPATHVIKEFGAGLNSGSVPNLIKTGPDRHLWFTDQGTTPAIGRVDVGGKSQEFPLASGDVPDDIALGPDGNMWFTDTGAGAIGKVTTPPLATTGGARKLGAGAADVFGTVNGHAQATSYVFRFGRTTAYGRTSARKSVGSGFTDVRAVAHLRGLKPGTTYHYRLEATNPTGVTVGADRRFTTPPAPRIQSLHVTPSTWHAGSKLPRITHKTPKPPSKGTLIEVSLNRAAGVSARFFRISSQVRFAGVIKFAGRKGKNVIRFEGPISKTQRLKPGSYRVTVTASDPTIKAHSKRSKTFVILGG